MSQETLFHGANGDNILGIIQSGVMRPGADDKIFFSRDDYASVFMHGGDRKRGAAFAIKVQVDVPPGTATQRDSTRGVQSTYVVITTQPLLATVVTLFVRERPGLGITQVHGSRRIADYLRARRGPPERDFGR